MPSRADVVELTIRRSRAARPKFIAVRPVQAQPGPNTVPVDDPGKKPFRSLGLLVDAQSGTATTGWLVSPDTIITAGHCLCRPEQRPRPRSFYFALQYTRKQGGLWSRVVAAATLWGWEMHRDHRYDIGICKLDQRYPRMYLKAWPVPENPPKECLVVGYAYGGAQLWQSHCTDLRKNSRGAHISADLSEGCSGGPWLVREGNNYRPVGITSQGGEGFLLSPAWGRGVENLLNW